MPKASELPRFRTCNKTGPAGQVWTSYWYDMRGTGHPDVPLGTDKAAALIAWQRLREGAVSKAVAAKRIVDAARPLGKLKLPQKGKRRDMDHPAWLATPWAKSMYLTAERRSREAKRAVFLTPTEFLEVVARAGGVCELTGIPFDQRRARPGVRAPFAASLDRIDCSKGYVAGNVRIVCLIVNCALGDFGEQAFEIAAAAFLKARCGSESLPRGSDLCGSEKPALVTC